MSYVTLCLQMVRMQEDVQEMHAQQNVRPSQAAGYHWAQYQSAAHTLAAEHVEM